MESIQEDERKEACAHVTHTRRYSFQCKLFISLYFTSQTTKNVCKVIHFETYLAMRTDCLDAVVLAAYGAAVLQLIDMNWSLPPPTVLRRQRALPEVRPVPH